MLVIPALELWATGAVTHLELSILDWKRSWISRLIDGTGKGKSGSQTLYAGCTCATLSHCTAAVGRCIYASGHLKIAGRLLFYLPHKLVVELQGPPNEQRM